MSDALTRAALLCTLAYVAAGAGAIACVVSLGDWHPIWQAAAADAVATVVVFAFSRGFDNSSFYDPYWSVAPLAIVPYWWWTQGSPTSARAALVAFFVGWWGIRLTYNWGRRWEGLDHEDWRYVDLREKHGETYWLVSFAGIHFLPTVLVFAGCVPAYWALGESTPLGAIDAAAAAVTTAAIAIESVADRQLHDFLTGSPRPGSFLSTGLWRYSRHPNYFGEVAFWWGLALFGIAAAPDHPWIIAGAAAITLLFVFISIPLIDTRMLARRDGYAEHVRRTSALVPWPPKRG